MEGDELENLERETVTVTKTAPRPPTSRGTPCCTARATREQTCTFDGGFTLGAGESESESVTVHTGEETDTETDVDLGSGTAVLNNEESETLALRDADGDAVDEEST